MTASFWGKSFSDKQNNDKFLKGIFINDLVNNDNNFTEK